MPWPKGDEYYTAVQHPETAFEDLELKFSKVERNPLGLPRPYAGGFTTTYRFQGANQSWAVRCFTRDVSELQARYIAIGKLIASRPSPYFVDAICLIRGICVAGTWYPIIKMKWVEGTPLNLFVSKNVSNPQKISALLLQFKTMVQEIGQLGFVHGDLQHGNIIVQNDKTFLIDYDSVSVPEISSLKSPIWGHINYQHPARVEGSNDPTNDRFPAIAIYLGLKATSISPQLWAKYDNSENILFRQKDFLEPDKSALLADLDALPDLKRYVDPFKKICSASPDKVPTLDQFLTPGFAYPVSKTAFVPAFRTQYPIIDGTDKASLLGYIGQRIEVVGQITDSRKSYTRYHQPYIFLNFGTYPANTFTLVLWSPSIKSFQQDGRDPEAYVGNWVSVTGVLGVYNNRPQMVVEQPSQIELLAGESEGRTRLQADHSTVASILSQSSATAVQASPVARTASVIAASRDISANAQQKHAIPLKPSTAANQPTNSGIVKATDTTSHSKKEQEILEKLYGSKVPAASSAPQPIARPQVIPAPSANTQPRAHTASTGQSVGAGQKSRNTSDNTIFYVLLFAILGLVVCLGMVFLAAIPRQQPAVAPFRTTGSGNTNPRPVILPTRAPATSVASDSGLSEQGPAWAGDFVQVPERWMEVCVDSASIFSGPGYEYPILGSVQRSEQWKIFGRVNDWLYIGYDEQKRDGFLFSRGLCEVSTQSPTDTAKATIIVTNKSLEPTSSTSQFETDLGSLQPIPRHGIPVCAPYAAVRSAPDLGASGVTSVAKDGLYFIDGKIGDWYSGTVDPNSIGPRTFVRADDLCFQPDPSSTCDDFLFQKWKNGKSENYTKPCTAQQ